MATSAIESSEPQLGIDVREGAEDLRPVIDSGWLEFFFNAKQLVAFARREEWEIDVWPERAESTGSQLLLRAISTVSSVSVPI